MDSHVTSADLTSNAYEPPTITRLGSLSELTKNGQQPGGDGGPQPDDAFTNASG